MTIVCCHERVGWPADLDLFGMLGIRGRREHAAYGFDGVAARPLVQRAGVPVEPEQPFDRAKADSAERSSSGASGTGPRMRNTVEPTWSRSESARSCSVTGRPLTRTSRAGSSDRAVSEGLVTDDVNGCRPPAAVGQE
jgi:hypothetical protein